MTGPGAAVAWRRSGGGLGIAMGAGIGGRRRRLTVAPRGDPEDGEVYGVAVRLAAQE